MMNVVFDEMTADRAGLLEHTIQSRMIYVEDEDFRLSDENLTIYDVSISDDIRENTQLLLALRDKVGEVLSLYYDAEKESNLRFIVKGESALYDFLPAKNPSGMALIALFTKKILILERGDETVLTVSKLFYEDVVNADDVIENLCSFLFSEEEQKRVVIEVSDAPVVRTQVLKKGLSVTSLYRFDFENALKNKGSLEPDFLLRMSETEKERKIRNNRESILSDISSLIHEIETQREG